MEEFVAAILLPTTNMLLLMATSAFGLRRTCQSSLQRCYQDHLHTVPRTSTTKFTQNATENWHKQNDQVKYLAANIHVSGPSEVVLQVLCANSDWGLHQTWLDSFSCCWHLLLVEQWWCGYQLRSGLQYHQYLPQHWTTLPRTTLLMP